MPVCMVYTSEAPCRQGEAPEGVDECGKVQLKAVAKEATSCLTNPQECPLRMPRNAHPHPSRGPLQLGLSGEDICTLNRHRLSALQLGPGVSACWMPARHEMWISCIHPLALCIHVNTM